MGFTVGAVPFRSQAFARGARMLRTALGSSIAGYLEDPSIVEIMLNPDGRLWIDRLASGLEDTGCRVSPADAERIVRLVAHHVGVEVHGGSPRVSAELPETGERFEGLVPPVVAAPCFAIRRPAVAVFTLERLRRGRHHVAVAGRCPAGGGPRNGRTCWSPAAPRPARRRSSTHCWRRSPRPATASS